MNRREPLILVDNPQLVSSGLWPDRHVSQTPLWETAENVQFTGGKAQRRVPNSVIPVATGVVAPVLGFGQMQASNGVRWLWFAQGGKIYRWYGPAAELINDFGSYVINASSTLDPTLFDFTPWGNWVIVNAADKGAWIFKPGSPNTFLRLAGGTAPQDAVAYFKKRNQLLAIGHGINHKNVSFSDADDIDSAPGWTPSPTNLAGSIPLEELSTPCRAACDFGGSIAVLGENQLFAINWVGSPFYYGQKKLLIGIGAVGKFAAVSDGQLLYGMSRNGLWKSDGLQYSYIDEVVLRDYVQNNVNWTQGAKACVRKNDTTGCIEFSFPIGASLVNNDGWAYDPRYGGWSRVPAFAAMDNRVLFSKPVQGQPSGVVQLVADDETIVSPLKLITKAMLIQRENQAMHIGALIDEVELFIHAANNVSFQYGVAEFPDGPFSWTTAGQIVTKQITYKLETPYSGTYHKLCFTSYEDDWALDLQGFALFGIAEGQKRDKA